MVFNSTQSQPLTVTKNEKHSIIDNRAVSVTTLFEMEGGWGWRSHDWHVTVVELLITL